MKIGSQVKDDTLAPREVEWPFVFGTIEPVDESGLEVALYSRLLPAIVPSTRGRMICSQPPLARGAERSKHGNDLPAVCGAGCAQGVHPGKRHNARTRHGNRWLRRVLTQAAWAATHEKPGSYLKSLYRRIARRRGKKRAIVAVGHTILLIAHCLLSTGAYYHDLGQDYFDHLDEERLTRYLVERLESLGHAVELQPAA